MNYEIDRLHIFHYTVNTFRGSEPVQIEDDIEAYSEQNAINTLIINGTVDAAGYEFLELEMVN